MRTAIEFDDIKFWVNQDIIHCKLYSELNPDYNKIDIEEMFYNGISLLSNGKHMPIIIDLSQLSYLQSFKIFKYLYHCDLIQSLILSQIFIVKSFSLKVILLIINLIKKPFYINKIRTKYNAAVKYCSKDNSIFNPISVKSE